MINEEIKKISPSEAHEKMQNGAALLDVREYPEWVQSHVPGATLLPLGDLKGDPQRGVVAKEVVMLCRTGRRAAEAAELLAERYDVKPFVIEGGLEAWQAVGLPSQRSPDGPIGLERQVRIGAGVLVLLGLIVPRLRVVSWFVPCGLIFAGLTDFCGMARLLNKMPWNRPGGDEKERSEEYSRERQS